MPSDKSGYGTEEMAMNQTLKLNNPICLEKLAGNDEKILVRQQSVFKGKVLILANNHDEKFLHNKNEKSHQHNRTSRVPKTHKTRKNMFLEESPHT